jgi:hypothetical protein
VEKRNLGFFGWYNTGMKKYILLVFWLLIVFVGHAHAQEAIEATEGAELSATESALVATPAAIILEPKEDLTQPTVEIKGRLARYLDEQELGPVSPANFLRYMIRAAIDKGVPPNTIVLVLLFPVIAAVIAASRHLIGLRGFGIYIPAVLSVAFVATGMVTGIALFLVILTIGTYGMRLLKRLKLQYLPRMALLLWLVSLGVLMTILVAPTMGIEGLATLNIFPILILMLLSENFHEVQMGKSRREAIELTIETLILALLSAMVISLDFVQRFALLHAEVMILGVAIANFGLGKYVGLRLTEYLKFKKLTE